MQFETGLEAYSLAAIKVVHESVEAPLAFHNATLYVDSDDISLAWFVDISGIENTWFLNRLSESIQIGVMLYARTDTGIEIAGEGHFHPNLSMDCGAVKGSGELIGYEQIHAAANQR